MATINYLSDQEISQFIDELDKDKDGSISYSEIEHKLDDLYHQLDPKPKEHHLHHPDKTDEQRHQFLRRMMGTEKESILAAEFANIVKSWNVPSVKQEKDTEKGNDNYMQELPLGRKLRAYWEVDGPTYCFVAFVIAWQIGLGTWQCVKYATGPQYQAAFGWGVGLAKACAGALYPTLFFLVLSMSRWFATFCRRYYYLSRFINWDLHQEFHIRTSIVAMVLGTLHAIGHLTGTFVFGSRSDRQSAVAALLGPDAVPRPYVDYIRSVPGWTGLTALGLFYSIAVLSMPRIRKFSYEVFQAGHLLMFPMIALLMVHGSAAYLQYPVLGFVLAIPTFLVFTERLNRIMVGFNKVPAHLESLDQDTVRITIKIPQYRLWRYKAGQYVFLQVPKISFFQWHPFTVSTCVGKELTTHIKTDGNWTGKLQKLTDLKYVGIDGPFGAPAQRFYDFDQAVIVGAGIGVTPFSGILNDLQTREDHLWSKQRDSASLRKSSKTPPDNNTNSEIEANTEKETSNPSRRISAADTAIADERTVEGQHGPQRIDLDMYRRVDFHWIVRDKNYLLWFSDLLNRISSGEHNPNLDVRIHNHLTKKHQGKEISTHVYRYLLERHRTPQQPVSPLTGLIAPTHFGRPDFPKIINTHYDEMQELFARDKKRKRTVGVFFCGAPVIGHQLADLCHEMTLRGKEDKSEVEYHFQMEVFG